MQEQTKAYPLGYSAGETGRLEQQAAFLNELTGDVLERAGLRPGMRVLDIGCGVGDVSFLAAKIVGSTGSVVGLDRDDDSLERARLRASAAQLTNVEFRREELPEIGGEGQFDALIGRLVMLYFPDPAAALRQMLARVVGGGVVAFHEPDLSRASAIPPVPTVTESVERMVAVFQRCGFHPRIGMSLGKVFEDAGLTASLLGMTRMEQGGDGFCPTWLAATIRSLVPAMVKTGVATEAEIDIGTLEDRIRNDAQQAGSLLLGPMMVGAWGVRPA